MLGALRFVGRAACAIPHPEKFSRGGEDGFYMAVDGKSLGVADGVGGWADSGVNPAFFTWNFMRRCLHYTTLDKSTMGIREILQTAWTDTVKTGLQGSCTTAVVGFEGAQGNELTVALVGDCGVIIIRGDAVVLRTKERQYKFNFPHQIGSDGASSPSKLAHFESVNVETNDVVILGTDGVFDNVFDAVNKGYRYGKFGLLDVLDAQRTLIETRFEYFDTLTEYHRQRNRLDALTAPAQEELL